MIDRGFIPYNFIDFAYIDVLSIYSRGMIMVGAVKADLS